MNETLDRFGLSAAHIDASGAHWTAREILQQPQIWLEVEKLHAAEAARLEDFLRPMLSQPDLRIVLTGAGSSAFIGECLAPALARKLARVEAIPTTDIVASPDTFLSSRYPTLIVSFARSGNSPESVAAVEFAERRVERCAHLIFTCNAEGALLQRARDMKNARVVLLPEASNDRSFAMTSSFTGMLLAAALTFRVAPAGAARLRSIIALADQVLAGCTPTLNALVHEGFERVVYLGSNELQGLAREAALKMLELTDGKVVAAAESTLGFRHGPKAILNERTLVVIFLSNDPYTRRYDLDLVAELRREAVAGRVVVLSSGTQAQLQRDDVVLAGSANCKTEVSDLELCLPYAVFSQSLAMLRALSLGVRPDNPSAAGTMSRVVQGVSIYPHGGSP